MQLRAARSLRALFCVCHAGRIPRRGTLRELTACDATRTGNALLCTGVSFSRSSLQGLRQIDVAVKLDCPQTRVSKYELGTRRLDLLELRDVCKVLGVSLVDFVRTFDTTVEALEAGERKGKVNRGRSSSKG